MKIFKLYGDKDPNNTFSFKGLKTLYNDGISRNDLQTAMAVIQWVNTMEIITELFIDTTELVFPWEGGTKKINVKSNTNWTIS